MIPQAAPALRFRRFGAAIQAALARTLESGTLILGNQVAAFEKAFAEYIGVRHCVGVNSGTDAVALALRALGIGSGSEVITVSMTAPGTAMGVLLAGAEPRFIDVDPATRCMDLDRLIGAITPRTAAVVPVHLHGFPMDMPRLVDIARRYGLLVVEDCAQAHGAKIGERRVGSFGHAAAFSFYPTKNLGCAGDGGAVVTDDPIVASRLRALRNYGWSDESRISIHVGVNSRLDELQAAILNVLLPHLDEGNLERLAIAEEYRRSLEGVDGLNLPGNDPGAVYHQFAVTVDARRDAVRDFLASRGIGTGVHYPLPLHKQPVFEKFCTAPLPATEALSEQMISLPIQPEVARPSARLIAKTLTAALDSCRKS
ncbi:MAG TPA: DegT/DnrJ/EryC1/StrS family aminotransferase [Candidatus Binatia bacterium]|nr:DegT/DnrJ/EryC1/StrS family aminotransferase [Candidatus Binatia bacterium]